MTNEFVFTHPKDNKGEDIKYMFMISFSKKLSEINAKLQKIITSVEGIDNIGPAGFYTIELSIARSFDADEVIAELKEKLENITSELIIATPQQTHKLKAVK